MKLGGYKLGGNRIRCFSPFTIVNKTICFSQKFLPVARNTYLPWFSIKSKLLNPPTNTFNSYWICGVCTRMFEFGIRQINFLQFHCGGIIHFIVVVVIYLGWKFPRTLEKEKSYFIICRILILYCCSENYMKKPSPSELKLNYYIVL